MNEFKGINLNSLELFVNKEQYVPIICPYCSHSSRLFTGGKKFKGSGRKMKIKCSCGNVFSIKLNFRQFYRKIVNLSGKMKNVSASSNDWLAVKIINLSFTGLRIKLPANLSINIGDRVEVKFTLDDPQKTDIHKEVRITNVNDEYCGGEFLNLATEEKRLGYFLFPS